MSAQAIVFKYEIGQMVVLAPIDCPARVTAQQNLRGGHRFLLDYWVDAKHYEEWHWDWDIKEVRRGSTPEQGAA